MLPAAAAVEVNPEEPDEPTAVGEGVTATCASATLLAGIRGTLKETFKDEDDEEEDGVAVVEDEDVEDMLTNTSFLTLRVFLARWWEARTRRLLELLLARVPVVVRSSRWLACVLSLKLEAGV
jgi:hypothetical protein